MIDTANSTNATNWTPAKVTKIPEIKFRVGTNGDKNLIFNMTDFVRNRSADNLCVFNLPVLLYTGGESHKDLVEGMTLGYEYFYRYESIEYDFDGYKIAFNGGHDFKPINPTPKP